MGLLGPVVLLCFVFNEPLLCSPLWIYWLVLTNREEGCFFSILSPAVIVDFLKLTILTCMSWSHIVLLIRSSLILKDAGHLFMCFVAIAMSSLDKCPFKSCELFLDIEVHKLLVCLEDKFFADVFVCKYSSILRVVFLLCLWFPLLCQCF